MSSTVTTVISVLLVFSGMAAVLIMLHLTGNPKNRGDGAGRLRSIHRLLGYLFILLFVVIFVYMLKRLPAAIAPLAAIHAALALTLMPLLLVKVLIARWFKRLYPQMTALGLWIFVLAFVMVSVVMGTHPQRGESSDLSLTADTALSADESVRAARILEDRCGRCHSLDKVNEAEKSVVEWRDTIARMSGYVNDPQFLTQSDAELLALHLSQRKPESGTP